MTTVLSAAPRALTHALRRLGLDPDPWLAQAGLDPSEVADPDARLEAEATDRLWAAAFAAAPGRPSLALEAAALLEPGDHAVFRYLGQHSPTLGACLEQVARYFAWVDARAEFTIVPHPLGHALELRIPALGAAPVPRPAAEFSLLATLRQSRAATGLAWQPAAVLLPFPEPDAADEARALRDTFGPHTRFATGRAALVLDAATWATPVPGADPRLGAMLASHAEALVADLPRPADETPEAEVRDAIAELLHAGEDPTADAVAARLRTSRRSLQRRLSDAGTTLRAELDAERTFRARHLLLDPSLSLGEVAWMLGFSEASAFSRAFRRWTSQSPSAWRRARLG